MPSSATQLYLPFGTRTHMSAQDFAISEANKEAAGWLGVSPTQWPAPLLWLHGPAGSGKTHLLTMWQAQHHAHSLTPNILAGDSLDSDISPDSCWVLDNADHQLHADMETHFFHLINLLKAHNAHLLCTSQYDTAQLDITLPDLQSRLLGAPSVALHAPDDALLAQVLLKQLHDRQLQVDPAVIDYLLPRIERSFSAVHKWVERLDTASLAQRRNITIPLIKRVLDAESEPA